MPELKATPRNDVLGALAEMLRAARDGANNYEVDRRVPRLGGISIGDLLAGNAPEEIDNWSYGDLPMHVIGGGTGSLIPQLKQGRATQLLDTAILAPMLAPVGRTAQRGALEALHEMFGRPTESAAIKVIRR